MILRKRLTALQRSMRAYKQQARLSIGETRDQVKVREAAEEADWIGRLRAKIWADRPACQLCGGYRRRECMGLEDQMHEEPPRSATRGRPLEERFNERVCGRLCAACHADVTRHLIDVVFEDPAKGFTGHVTSVSRGIGPVADELLRRMRGV